MSSPKSAFCLRIGAVLFLLAGCSGSSGGPEAPANVSGATANGGATTSPIGGRASGGAANGGSVTSGKANGGSPNGGSVTGGKANGGSTDGGSLTGGKANGGTPNGGSVTGGKASGGTANGGSAAGSRTSGGNSSIGGASTGGAAAAGSPVAGGGAAAAGSTARGGHGGASNSAGAGSAIALPTPNASFDYQIGGAYTPPAGVKVVSRDRNSAPAAGLYNICYVNGFQIQPGEESFWTGQHPTLVLRDAAENPVVDEDWQETLLDTSTATKRAELATVIGGWIAKCKTDGFDAVEIDNLDSYGRSNGLLTRAHNVAFMTLLASAAHGQGLAIAQKNSSELLGSVGAMGTDFAIVEECNRYDECDTYKSGYGNRVYVIEYRSQDFQTGCNTYPELSIVLRDLNVSTPNSSSYVYQGC